MSANVEDGPTFGLRRFNDSAWLLLLLLTDGSEPLALICMPRFCGLRSDCRIIETAASEELVVPDTPSLFDNVDYNFSVLFATSHRHGTAPLAVQLLLVQALA